MKVLRCFFPFVSMFLFLSLVYLLFTLYTANEAAAAVLSAGRDETTIYSLDRRDGMKAVPVKAVEIGGLYLLTDLKGVFYVTLEAEPDQNYIAWLYLDRVISLEKDSFSFSYESDFHNYEILEALENEILKGLLLKHI